MSISDDGTIPAGSANPIDPEPNVSPPYAARPYVPAPRELLRDSKLKPAARLLLLILLDRQHRTRPWTLLRRDLLANDLGVTLATVDRLIAGLVKAKRLETRRTRDGLLFRPQRPEVVTSDDSRVVKNRPQSRQNQTPESSKSLFAKQVDRSQEIESKQAAGSGADSLAVQELLLLLPERIRPSETDHVVGLIQAAVSRGWTATGLAQALLKEVTSDKAGPGVTVVELEKLSQQPPSEHPQKVERLPEIPCSHGVPGGGHYCAMGCDPRRKAKTEAAEKAGSHA